MFRIHAARDASQVRDAAGLEKLSRRTIASYRKVVGGLDVDDMSGTDDDITVADNIGLTGRAVVGVLAVFAAGLLGAGLLAYWAAKPEPMQPPVKAVEDTDTRNTIRFDE